MLMGQWHFTTHNATIKEHELAAVLMYFFVHCFSEEKTFAFFTIHPIS